MSLGVCFCPCIKNGHAPASCTGEADTSRPRRPSQTGYVELPVCAPCAKLITPTHDQALLAPGDPDHVPDMPSQTPAQRRSFLAGQLTSPRPQKPS